MEKGKTNKCLNKTGLKDDSLVFRKFTSNGWINEIVIESMLNYIYEKVNHQKYDHAALVVSVLILDQYSVHTTKTIKDIDLS